MAGQYAQTTEVPAERSRAEVEKTLKKYGASSFAYGWEGTRAVIGFQMSDRRIRFELPLPDPADQIFHRSPTGRPKTATAANAAYEQAVRQRWRALALMVKAKLEAVASGIVTFEAEFLPHTVLPSGRTVFEDIAPAVAAAYVTGRVAPLQIEGRA